MRQILTVVGLVVAVAVSARADVVTFSDSWGDDGFNVVSATPTGVEIIYSVSTLGVEELVVDGEVMQVLSIPGALLPNDEGAPNLPGEGRFIALPQGASAQVRVLASRTEVFHDINLAPAPPIPLDTDRSPPAYGKDMAIYGVNAHFPAEPVRLSRPRKLRGVDVVILGITPFQYNPITRELVAYKDLHVSVEFVGGNGHFGEDRLRSRWWETILQGHLLNYSSLPRIDFSDPSRFIDSGYEYVIIVPDDPPFIAWGDTVKAWRKLQGISSEVFTVTEVGGNSADAIEAFVDSAYANWTPAPVAFLLLSDYENSGDGYGITSPEWNSYCVSDNIYADVDDDDLPDINFARICAQNETHLSTMISKFLSYEREPYTDEGFYDHPLMACGWQTERWFQLCTEIIRGYLINVQGKDPGHEYNVFDGMPSPGCEWSTNINTPRVIMYFGSQGLGYVPDTNPYSYAWWDSGSADGITAAINAGAFIVQHRDHGEEYGWGEPDYTIDDLVRLTNDMYPFVFTINCLTGKFNSLDECFTEAFHRMEHGALGLLAATETSYSFVNDTYVWGYYDSMWPEFMPDYPEESLWVYQNLMPGFGNVSGKYFLESSSWPYNPGHKVHTYHLFHMHGDAFTCLYTEVPQALTVSHDPMLPAGQNFFVVTADDSSLIALTVDGEIIGVAEGEGVPVTITIPPQNAGDMMLVTVTKANYFRYESEVPVVGEEVVSIELVPDATVYAPGETLGFTATLTNNTQQVQSFYGITEVTLPNGNPYPGNPVLGPQPIVLDPAATVNRYVAHFIPYSAPAGVYTYTATIGTPPDNVIDTDSFDFEVLP